MDRGQIAVQLMALYGKLRRATDAQVKASIKGQIDALVAQLRSEGPSPAEGASLSRPGFGAD